MKKFKIVLSMILIVSLVLALFAACATKEPAPSADTQNKPASEVAPKADSDPKDEPQSEEEETEPEEVATVVFYVPNNVTHTDEGLHRIQDAMNEILRDKIGVEVEMSAFELAEYQKTLSLGISSNERIDLACCRGGTTSFSVLRSSNQMMDIADLVDTYAPETKEIVKDTISAFAVGDKLYAIPNYRNFAANLYIICNQGVLDELGLTDQFYAMKDWTDYEEILGIVKEKTNMWPIGGKQMVYWRTSQPLTWESDSFDFEVYDTLGDSIQIVHAAVDEPVVGCVYEEEGTIRMMKKAKEWYDRGYVYPDCYLTQEANQDLLGSGTIFSLIMHSELGVESTWSTRAKMPVACFQIGDHARLVNTANIESGSMFVPITAEEPEAAVRLLNEFYTNPEIVNLLYYGQESIDYVMNDAGEACYPEDDSTVGWHNNDFLCANFFLGLPWDGTGADFRQRAFEANAAAAVSPYLGFVPDTTNLDLYTSSLSVVKDEYEVHLNCGFYSDEEYDQMMAKFESVGLREYLAEFQTQLDAWLAANK